MLPPLNISTAQDNPKFNTFYENLATILLDTDGSTRVSEENARRHASIEEGLIAAQHAAAKIAILRSALMHIYNQSLPDELQDLATLIASPPYPKDNLRLGDFIRSHAPDASPLGIPVSEELSLLLNRLLHVADPLSRQACTVDQISTRRKELEKSRTELHDKRLELANTACTSYETQQDVFTTTIKALESVKYGSVARANIAQTGYLAAASEGLDEKLRVMKLEALQSIYDPQVKNAIEAYRNHLIQVRARLKARERSAMERLHQYDEVGRSMGEIAHRYVELVQEVENVKAQISRLDDKKTLL